MVQRVQTGIEGLDEVIQGGFPKGSMILLGGNPGTGKTIFGGTFLYHGGKNYENGLYISFSEGREAFINNMSSLGLDFEALEHENRFKILDLVTIKEAGLDTLMEMITNEIDTFGVQRLVIDSFTALTNAFEKPIDMRITLHLLSKIIRQSGCTTIITTEIPTGRRGIGWGIEEFIADGIIILKKTWKEGRLLRELDIEKMRGTRVAETRRLFTLHNGFKVFKPFEIKPVGKRRKFEPIPHQDEIFSTGSQEFDETIGGGLPKGSVALFELEAEIPQTAFDLLFCPIKANFISQGHAVLLLPPSGGYAKSIYKTMKEYLSIDEEINKFLRVIEAVSPYLEREMKYVFVPKAQNMTEKYEEIIKFAQELRKETGKQLLNLFGLDIDETTFREEIFNVVKQMVIDNKMGRDLLILVSRPKDRVVTNRIVNNVDIYVRIISENGIPLLYGIRPKTPLYGIELDYSKGYRLPKFTPII